MSLAGRTLRPADPGTELPAALLVDDDPQTLALLGRILEGDFQIRTARSGAEALRVLGESPVALIVADQRMPGMTGTAFLERAARESPQSRRVLLTAFADLDAVIEAVNAGQVHYFVRKPWDNRDLVTKL